MSGLAPVQEANRRPRRRLDDERRPQILAAAIELIREQGLWRIRIADIARRAGVSPTTVVYYFGTKEQLLADAISGADNAFYDAVLPELARLGSAQQRIAWLVVRASTTEWLLSMEQCVYARHHPEAALAQRRLERRWLRTLEEIITDGQRTGEWVAVQPRDAAMRLGALMDGLAVQMVLGDTEHTPERFLDMTLVAVSYELGCDLAELRGAAAAALAGTQT